MVILVKCYYGISQKYPIVRRSTIKKV